MTDTSAPRQATAVDAPIGPWRLEWLRLRRTPRLVVVVALFAFLGLTGPLTVRYLPELLDRFAPEMEVTVPPPDAAEGIASYTSNVQQLGVLAICVVAVGSMGFVTRRGLAWFYRTRVRRASQLVLPRATVIAAAAIAAHTVGLAGAWYETAVLIDAVPAGAMVAGWALSSCFVVFAVAVSVAAAAVIGSSTAAAATSIGALWLLPVAGVWRPLGRLLPTSLASAPAELVAGASIAEQIPALAVTVVATAVALVVALRAVDRREL